MNFPSPFSLALRAELKKAGRLSGFILLVVASLILAQYAERQFATKSLRLHSVTGREPPTVREEAVAREIMR